MSEKPSKSSLQQLHAEINKFRRKPVEEQNELLAARQKIRSRLQRLSQDPINQAKYEVVRIENDINNYSRRKEPHFQERIPEMERDLKRAKAHLAALEAGE